jgi:PPOX class probable F420-dependent enzyme
MAARASVRLSEDEIWAFLEQGHTGILTTLRRDGCPIALPVWYAVLDRAVYVRGPAHTKKWKRIERDPRVSFLVEEGLAWRELQAVQLNGRAVFVEDEETLRRVGERLDEKYAGYRTQRKAMPEGTRKHYGSGSRTVQIEPEGRILNWNNARLELAD